MQIFFSHRPIDLVNFYCEQQVYMVLKDGREESFLLPDYDNIYRDYEVIVLKNYIRTIYVLPKDPAN